MYHIDHEGIDGRWRVWWVRPDGRTAERLFGSRRQAERWAEYMGSLAPDAAGTNEGGEQCQPT